MPLETIQPMGLLCVSAMDLCRLRRQSRGRWSVSQATESGKRHCVSRSHFHRLAPSLRSDIVWIMRLVGDGIVCGERCVVLSTYETSFPHFLA